MSALWTRILTGMIERGAATAGAVDGALARGALTGAEHTSLLAPLETAEEPDGDLAS